MEVEHKAPQDIRWAVKEEGNEQLHQTLACLLMVTGRRPEGERRNPPCPTLLQERSWDPAVKMHSVQGWAISGQTLITL